MKKIIVLLLTVLLYNCTDNNIQNNCFVNVSLNQTINLSNPEFINIQVPGGHTITNISGRRVVIIRRTSSAYKAFDLECPEKDCTTPMSFDGLKLICACSKKEYNSLNGSPINGEGCLALEYNVLLINSSTLQISR